MNEKQKALRRLYNQGYMIVTCNNEWVWSLLSPQGDTLLYDAHYSAAEDMLVNLCLSGELEAIARGRRWLRQLLKMR